MAVQGEPGIDEHEGVLSGYLAKPSPRNRLLAVVSRRCYIDINTEVDHYTIMPFRSPALQSDIATYRSLLI